MMDLVQSNGGFNWLNQKEINKFYVNLISEKSLHGYILEFDLGYSDKFRLVDNAKDYKNG